MATERRFILAIFVSLLIFPIVISNDDDPIPASKTQINTWFKKNVLPFSSRSDLDPKLVAAEKNPKFIKVSQDGNGDFKTITDAVKSIPANNNQRVVVQIAGGIYFEKVTINPDQNYVTFYGSPNGMPTLVYNGTAARYGTVYSATLTVQGSNFVAANIIIKNSAPRPDPKRKDAQAVAMRAFGDMSTFYNVKLIGFQDTLCDDIGKHFYKDCYIQGTVDFIFGRGKTIFLNTELHVVQGDYVDVITAQTRDAKTEDSGYSFVHCSVTGKSSGNTYLGRDLNAYATVVYSYSDFSDVVNATRWSTSHYEKTVFFGEYQNKAKGTTEAGNLNFAQAKPFLILSYIEGSKWLLPPPSF